MKFLPFLSTKCYSFFTLLVISLFVNISSQAQKISDFLFDTYLIKEGMSQSSPLSIYQDKVGYVWVGTQAGVDRFDGYNFKQYTNDSKNKDSRASGWVYDIAEDKSGNIWTVDNYGHFSFLNRKTDKWTNFDMPIRDTLMKKDKTLPFYYGAPRSIYIDSNTNRVWLGTIFTGLISFDVATKKYKQYLVHPENPKNHGNHELVQLVKGFSKDKLVVATDMGLQYFDTKNYKFSKIFNVTDSMLLASPIDFKIVGPTLYVATKFGAFIYNTETKSLQKFVHKAGDENSIAEGKVNGIHYSSKYNYLWLAITGAGIDIVNLTNNKVVHLNKENAKDNGITESNYADILEDKDHNIWIGSAISGLLKYDPNKRIFNLMSKDYPSDFNLGLSSTWGMTVDSKGIIWLGEYESGGGLLAVDRVKKTKKSYLKNVNGTTLRAWKILEDYKGNIYAFSGGRSNDYAIYRKAYNQDQFVKVGMMNDFLPTSSLTINGTHFIDINHSTILTGDKPIVLSDSNGNFIFKFYDLPKGLEKGITAIEKKSTNEFYVANLDGISLFNDKTREVKRITKNISVDPSVDLFSSPTLTIIDDKMAFYASYGKGLIKIDFEKQTKTYLTLQDGIPNLFLYDLYADKNKIIWASSNFGLIRYNPYTNKFRSFGPAEGVQDYEFNSNSSYQAPSGEIFFNGVAGLNYFQPELIKENTTPPVVIIQKFSTKDSTIYIESSKFPTTIEVDYKNNNLAFEYIAFNFRDPLKNKYAYKMEGYDEDWIQAGTRRFVSYTNLSEGTYTFRVKAANSDGVWNEEGAAMIIKIHPPIWRTWWAYILYFIATIGFIYAFSKYRERQQKKKLEDERKNNELAEAKDLQERLLPKTLPAVPNLDIATYLRTSTEVGGDYYDFFLQEDGSLYAICGDATGHGTPSGMLVSITKAGIIGLPEMEPKEMLRALNKVVKKVDLGILRMSLNIAHLKGEVLTLSSAGMPPYFIYRAENNTTDEIMISGIPLGSFNEVHFDQIVTTFKKGDILAIISDGLAEAPDLTGDLFDYPRIQSILQNNHAQTAEEITAILMKEADQWLSGRHNPDDITIVIIKHR